MGGREEGASRDCPRALARACRDTWRRSRALRWLTHHPSAVAIYGKGGENAKLLVGVPRVGLEALARSVIPVVHPKAWVR